MPQGSSFKKILPEISWLGSGFVATNMLLPPIEHVHALSNFALTNVRISPIIVWRLIQANNWKLWSIRTVVIIKNHIHIDDTTTFLLRKRTQR